eukprot:TRINITY_DN5120_c0_g1_i3.p1 TRINITY_DN5120_c0_g1~~TRINITY_DN5120_c0_g1_i3.p1  ORF type:complete len:157 (-),score=11.41 TRINITY_DN5120_c0_g1_i3:173-643(-)
MCEHKAAMACYAETPECQAGGPLDNGTIGMLDCMCEACPSVMNIMSEPPTDMTAEEGRKYMCSLMGPMECIQREPSKCAAVKQMMSRDGSSLEQLLGMKSMCETTMTPGSGEDRGEGMTCGMVAQAYEKAGCCGNPGKKFEMPEARFRPLQAVPPV